LDQDLEHRNVLEVEPGTEGEVPSVLAATASVSPLGFNWSGTGRAAKAIRGGAWSIGGYVATQLFRTVSTLVLAKHFLGPETFGVVGLVGVFLAGLSMFSELGIQANVVQHQRGDDPQFLNTAFTIQLARGLTIWFISILAAYPLAQFYNMPQILPLLMVAGASEMLRGMVSTSVWTLARHVNLRGITLLTVGSEVVGFGVCVAWAIWSPSAWALIARTIVSAGVLAFGSHFIAKPSVRPAWDSKIAKDILHFGGWISLATAAYFMGSQGERLFLGKYITAAELGCFSLAVMISTVPAAGIGQLMNQIFLPMISKSVRTNRARTISDFKKARWAFFGMGLIAAIGFLAFGNPLVTLLLSPKYQMTGWMLQLLGLRVALDLFAGPSSNLIMAYGKTKYSAAANFARLVLMAFGVWVTLTRFGLREAIIALVIAQAISYIPLVLGIKRLLPEVVHLEIRLYVLFLVLLLLAFNVPWPTM
jgi:O-antigen/teichoic acid export membrane protein